MLGRPAWGDTRAPWLAGQQGSHGTGGGTLLGSSGVRGNAKGSHQRVVEHPMICVASHSHKSSRCLRACVCIIMS